MHGTLIKDNKGKIFADMVLIEDIDKTKKIEKEYKDKIIELIKERDKLKKDCANLKISKIKKHRNIKKENTKMYFFRRKK